MKTNRKKWLGLAAASAIAVAGISAPTILHTVQFARAEQEVEASRQQIANVQDIASVYKAVGKAVEPSVVSITVTKTTHSSGRINSDMLKKFFPDRDGDGEPDVPEGFQFNLPDNSAAPQIQQGTGSGVIMDFDGKTAYILTNNHVAGDATEMDVTLWDGREIKGAKLVGADPKSDLAVVKIEAGSLIPAHWGDSDTLEKGDVIMAFGSPFGYVGSMTHGIVSALHRQARIIENRYAYENFIQVDAPINPGNSGGPLVNLKGEVVGINTAIATESGGFQGLGFAIPSDQAHYVYDSIKSKGKVTRGWLGVEIADVAKNMEMAESLGFKDHKGVFVRGSMKDTPASGKLVNGDIITALNGKSVGDTDALRTQIAATAPGTEIKLSVFRDKKTEEVAIKLGEQPDDRRTVASATGGQRNAPNYSGIDSLGLSASGVTDELASKYKLDGDAKGVVITRIKASSLAARAGLAVGDVITRINDTKVTSADELNDALAKNEVSKGVRIYYTDGEGSHVTFVKATDGQ